MDVGDSIQENKDLSSEPTSSTTNQTNDLFHEYESKSKLKNIDPSENIFVLSLDELNGENPFLDPDKRKKTRKEGVYSIQKSELNFVPSISIKPNKINKKSRSHRNTDNHHRSKSKKSPNKSFHGFKSDSSSFNSYYESESNDEKLNTEKNTDPNKVFQKININEIACKANQILDTFGAKPKEPQSTTEKNRNSNKANQKSNNNINSNQKSKSIKDKADVGRHSNKEHNKKDLNQNCNIKNAISNTNQIFDNYSSNPNDNQPTANNKSAIKTNQKLNIINETSNTNQTSTNNQNKLKINQIID